MVDRQYGARMVGATAEACTVCGSTVFLSESTFEGLTSDGGHEVHVSEECGHRVTRVLYVTCRPCEGERWEVA